MSAPAPTPRSSTLVLNSWKEIASYLGRGVRTVQRYERELHLPIRRPSGRSRSAVIALSDELDTWLRQAPNAQLEHPQQARLHTVVATVRKELERGAELRNRCEQLRDANREALATLLSSVKIAAHAVGNKDAQYAGGNGENGSTPRKTSVAS